MSFILTFIIMLIFWILLSGEFNLILLISAVFASLFVAYISRDLLIGDADIRAGVIRIWRTLKYLPWLLWQILLSNIDLVYRTLHPKMPIDPCVVKFDTSLRTDIGITILANSITLTPGTVTVDATRDGAFMVHAIAKEPAESLLAGEMQQRVDGIERG
ncbi:MAG: Na+/H+ antiporter subunit E [Deltaproteobacteria bacterium]|nr:Na+/H+ antiporter subunit E [Deltaproteobacteria bacterium]